LYVYRINLNRNIDVSPSKTFQGHTGPIHDLCQISIGKFQLILTASSDLSVRVCSFFLQKKKNENSII